jgi:hypothetical protein
MRKRRRRNEEAMMTNPITKCLKTVAAGLACAIMVLASADTSDARNVRGGAHVNVHGKANVSRNVKKASNVNVKKNVNRNVNVRRPAYRPVDIDVRRGYPVARGVAAGTAAAVTAAAVGSMVYSLPSGCHHEKVNGVWYYRCGDVWYEQRYSGSNQSYVVVNSPR